MEKFLDVIVGYFSMILPADASKYFLGAILSFIPFLWTRYQYRAALLEQSFNALQRINEAALRSDENVLAALRSVRASDETSADQGRIFYFNYMRINRMFRAYEYRRYWLISRRMRDRIIKSHLSSVLEAKTYLPELLERGYPKDFVIYLLKELEKIKEPAPHILAPNSPLKENGPMLPPTEQSQFVSAN